MHGGHMAGMAPAPANATGGGMHMGRHHMMMHMTFYWGKEALILFHGWPGSDTGMYALSLVFVFFLAALVEFLTHCKLIKDGSNYVVAGLIRTVMHLVRVGLAYLVMLAVMSFNVGVLIAAVLGHALGFLVFGSGVFGNSHLANGKTSDLPPMSC